MTMDNSNQYFQLAADFIQNTSRHVFLTGKAGTGKTTFLRYIKENSTKNTAIVAPTGVAAINAGGMTMHSFFQLPFGPFIPDAAPSNVGIELLDRHSLFKNLRLSHQKRAVIQELELLIIDEVSMLRCDTLDMIDVILRTIRKKNQEPFGGIQMFFIGDLFQLPPVMPTTEWDFLKQYYVSPFFFHARVFAQKPPLYIELKKIYRQKEQLFIDLLNRVRNNTMQPEDFQLLNSRYQPSFQPSRDNNILLTTHNKRADAINNTELEKLPGVSHQFQGKIEGEFSEKSLPTEMVLQLKEGAQVMFIKNEVGELKRYYNGKIAMVHTIKKDVITVVDKDSGETFEVEKEKWENIRYTLDKSGSEMQEEVLGTFTQYPIRLAWAITIHKSQGLTFERAVIDAGSSFAPGQVYVALSRCKSLNGLTLKSQIEASAISTDHHVLSFSNQEKPLETILPSLLEDKHTFSSQQLLQLFNFQKLEQLLQQTITAPGLKKFDSKESYDLIYLLIKNLHPIHTTANQFQKQLTSLFPPFNSTIINIGPLEQRVNKAIPYFFKELYQQLIYPIQSYSITIQKNTKARKYLQELQNLEGIIRAKAEQLLKASFLNITLYKGDSFIENIQKSVQPQKLKPESTVKGESHRLSLQMFKEGKTIAEISGQRQLALSTIEGHLVSFIGTGELEIEAFITKDKLTVALPEAEKINGYSIAALKEILGNEFSFSEIRAIMQHKRRRQEAMESSQ